MTDTDPAPRHTIRWWRWGGADLALPDHEGVPHRQGRRVPRSVLVAAGLVVLATAGVVPAPWSVTTPGRLVDVDAAVDVRIDGDAGALHGRIVVPLVDPQPTLLATAAAVLRPDQRVARAPVDRVRGIDPVASALLVGHGVAPGRGDPDALGLLAHIAPDGVAPTQLGVLLAIVDMVNSADLTAGRTVLAIGTVEADGSVSCPPGIEATLGAADAPDVPMGSPLGPDLLIVPAGCPVGDDVRGRMAVLEVWTLEEAVAGLPGNS